MAEYFATRNDAERFMQEWYPKDKTRPVFFGKILNHDEEKWIVNYDPRQDPRSSPFIKLLEDHSHEIAQVIAVSHEQPKPTHSEPAYQITADYRSGELQRDVERQERAGTGQDGSPEATVAGATRRFPIKHQSAFAVAFSPKGTLLAAGQYGHVTVWDADTGNVVTEIKLSNNNAVHPVHFTPDGLMLGAGSYSDSYTGEITLWSPTSGQNLGKLQNDSGDLGHSFAFSQDGNVLALGARKQRVHIFEVNTGRRLNTITTKRYCANSIVFSTQGMMATGGVVPREGSDSVVKPGVEVWDSRTFQSVRVLEAVDGFYIVNALAFSPDGSRLAAGLSGNGGRLFSWDMKSFTRTDVAVSLNDAIETVAFSPDGRYLAAGSGKRVRIWDIERGEFQRELEQFTDAVNTVSFSPDGRYFAAGANKNSVCVWPSKAVNQG